MLTERMQGSKIQIISDLIIGLCVDTEELSTSGDAYFSKSNSRVIDICMVLDECKDYVGTELNRKLSEISDLPTPAPSEETAVDPIWEAVIKILSVFSKNVYEDLRIPLAKSHNITRKNTPSYYSLTKHCPVVEGSILKLTFDVLSGNDVVVHIGEKDFEEQLEEIEAKLEETKKIYLQVDIEVDQTNIVCEKIDFIFSKTMCT